MARRRREGCSRSVEVVGGEKQSGVDLPGRKKKVESEG
jgi:hypothetical protein